MAGAAPGCIALILGIGVDAVSIDRIDKMLARRGSALARRLLRDAEYREFLCARRPASFLARRFAAREAAAKALGTGISNGVRWRDLQVVHDEHGAPRMQLHGAAAKRARQMGAVTIHLSISDEQDLALAFVVLGS